MSLRSVGVACRVLSGETPTLIDVVSRIQSGRHKASGGDIVREDSTFADALASVHAAPLRPEVLIEEVPAPTRLAPSALALSGEVIPSRNADDEPIATGRFVLLHDPAEPEPWEGAWRVVTYAKATVEPEVGHDPYVGRVGWSWLTDALSTRGLEWAAEAGTVTCVLSESFGALAEREPSVEMEIRASWTPLDGRIDTHLQAWGDLLCAIAGLPPLPEGVVALPQRR